LVISAPSDKTLEGLLVADMAISNEKSRRNLATETKR